MVKKDFQVEKNNLFITRFVENKVSELSTGEVLLKIEKYAFTSNNITYGIVGDKINYWEFFPAENPWGALPVWGFASVEKSANTEIKEGERFFGYYPMSSHLRVIPDKVKPQGFTDASEHRSLLPPLYNFYSRSLEKSNPKEDFLSIIRPLFGTGFLVYHFLKNNNFFDAKNIILTSASSKTALSLAFLLNKNKKEDGRNIIACTSEKNVEFVKRNKIWC